MTVATLLSAVAYVMVSHAYHVSILVSFTLTPRMGFNKICNLKSHSTQRFNNELINIVQVIILAMFIIIL